MNDDQTLDIFDRIKLVPEPSKKHSTSANFSIIEQSENAGRLEDYEE